MITKYQGEKWYLTKHLCYYIKITVSRVHFAHLVTKQNKKVYRNSKLTEPFKSKQSNQKSEEQLQCVNQ